MTMRTSGILHGKRALVTGVASNRSIAWGIAQAMQHEGAEIALTYQNEKLKPRVEKLADSCGCKIVLPCDVSEEEQVKALFDQLARHWNGFDALVHSIAFAPREALEGDFIDNTSRASFNLAHEVSSYSLTVLAKYARTLLENNGAILTLTYLGATRAVPGYNVMGLAKASLEANMRYLAVSLGSHGIRVNAISAGPIRTLAASGISGFRKMLDYARACSPLGRNVSIEDVGNAGAFLCSELAGGVTGQVLYVDAGFSVLGMPADH